MGIAGYSVLLWPVFWLFNTCSCANLAHHTGHCYRKEHNIEDHCYFFSLAYLNHFPLQSLVSCVVLPQLWYHVSGYKDSLVKSLCVGSGFLGNDYFFLFFLSLIQKAVWKWMSERSLVICVAKFFTFLDRCHVRRILKIHVTCKITRTKRTLFFSSFLGKGIHFLSFHLSLFFFP